MASTKQRELEQSKQHRKPATRIEILSRKRKKWMYSLTTIQVPYSEIPFTSGKSTNFSFINLGSWLGLGLGFRVRVRVQGQGQGEGQIPGAICPLRLHLAPLKSHLAPQVLPRPLCSFTSPSCVNLAPLCGITSPPKMHLALLGCSWPPQLICIKFAYRKITFRFVILWANSFEPAQKCLSFGPKIKDLIFLDFYRVLYGQGRLYFKYFYMLA